MVFDQDSTNWLMDISRVLGPQPDLCHFGSPLHRTGVQSSEIQKKKKTFAKMVIFDAKSGDLILMGFVSLMLFEFVRIPKVREEKKPCLRGNFKRILSLLFSFMVKDLLKTSWSPFFLQFPTPMGY